MQKGRDNCRGILICWFRRPSFAKASTYAKATVDKSAGNPLQLKSKKGIGFLRSLAYLFGSGGRARTCDNLINSQTLCQLSYAGIPLINNSQLYKRPVRGSRSKSKLLAPYSYRHITELGHQKVSSRAIPLDSAWARWVRAG